jgi:hypothetical protein
VIVRSLYERADPSMRGSPFWDLKSAKPAESDSKIFEALTPDDDRLNAAVSRAGIAPGSPRDRKSALETVPVQSGAAIMGP